MKIALLGGGFDPVHWGHIKLLEKTDALFSFDKIFLIPSKRPPHKPPFQASDSDRLEMLKLAIEGSAVESKTEISNYELDADRKSYSIYTISHFTEKYPGAELYFILGMDAFYGIPDWYEFPKVLKSCNFIVVSRRGTEGKKESIIEELSSEGNLHLISPDVYSAQKKQDKKIFFVNIALPEISSTQIRLCLQLGAEPLNLVPAKLEGFLKSNKLYSTLQEEKKS